MRIRKLEEDDNLESFSCGVPEYDNFLRRYAYANQDSFYVGVTYVADDDGEIVGYFTIAGGHLRFDELPADLWADRPRYPAPIMRLARLAVDTRHCGQGIGKALVGYALRLALRQRDLLGCIGVLVDALPERASFYEGLEFMNVDLLLGRTREPAHTVTMFLPIEEIALNESLL